MKIYKFDILMFFMASCKKSKLIDRVLNGDIPESLRRLIAYGNQLNGMKHLYDEGKLKISKREGERLERAYFVIENAMASRGVDLNYVPHRREELYLDKHRKVHVLK